MIEIIVNSSSESSIKKLVDLKECLKKENISYKIFKTTNKINATKLMDKISCNKIIVIGGDGTINEVINNYHNEDIIYIASGSGNDLARSLKLSKSVSEAVEIIKVRNVEQYDVGSVNGRKFCSGFDIGFNADIIRRVESSKFKKYFKKNIYMLCGIFSIFKLKKYNVKIEYNNKVFKSDKLYLLNIMIQPYEGGGIRFSNNASAKDGLLHIMIIENMSFLTFIYNYLCLIFNKHKYLKNVKYIQSDKISVITNQKYYQIDGELVFDDKKLDIECINNFYKIKVNKNTYKD